MEVLILCLLEKSPIKKLQWKRDPLSPLSLIYWELIFSCFNEGENLTISAVLPFLLQERLAERDGIRALSSRGTR